MGLRQKFLLGLTALVAVILIGTVGFFFLEEWSLLDSLYMTVISITTVGFGEVHPLSTGGRVFAIFLIIAGLGVVLYSLGELTRTFVEGEIRLVLGRRKVEREVKRIKEHFIICGFGRIGHILATELQRRGVDFLIIETDEQRLREIEELGHLCVAADATSDDGLLRAGIERAKCLIASLASDADNLFITLSARQLSPELYIIARAESEEVEEKFMRAGANKVICPYRIGALQIAQAALRPNVIDFLEIAVHHRKSLEIAVEELRVPGDSPFVGKSLQELALSRTVGVIIIGIKRKEQMLFNPSAESRLEAGDILIALGSPEQLKSLESAATA